ncbi:MAG TPA: methyltransferase domain-containing protein [Acidobacteriaceae bacterium]|jgi:ubiquinone/menaquinone biosynthesis C-methylase UbiE|nr:methyltransferase domain-containing protein [Acidobacteriaceae bacterium]
MERIHKQELLDMDDGSPEDVACSLRSLCWINRLFGGNRMHKRMLLHVQRSRPMRKLDILEVAAGYATVLQSAAKKLIRQNVELRILLLDRSAQHLPKLSQWDASLPKPTLIHGDALQIPLPDQSVDIVSCCLFFHHLDETEALAFLKEALRVSRVAVLINDLERGRIHYLLSRLAGMVDPSRFNKQDGPASVQKAYTRAELRSLLAATGCDYSVQRGFLYRLGAIAWQSKPQTPASA